ncbi:ACT domain-containing protein [Candidatus Thorarchaeota archaeon]|nr:MAG: ACT domain-containing protein [Candidatus Thorarchaeota archaeon]
MSGYRDLSFLLKNMEPVQVPGSFIFTKISGETLETLGSSPILVYREAEAITVILTKEIAEAHSLPYESVWSLISLTVHSDLEAVGLLAKVTGILADAGITTNVVSAYYHDHLFVPQQRVQEALIILKNLSNSIVE